MDTTLPCVLAFYTAFVRTCRLVPRQATSYTRSDALHEGHGNRKEKDENTAKTAMPLSA